MMTREEAIAILAESKRQNEVIRDNPSTFFVSHQMANGVKNAERRIVALDMALSALRPVSREQVVKVWRGEWEYPGYYDDGGSFVHDCSKCNTPSTDEYWFCPHCGAPMTDDAVEMVMERLEALHETV